jgi:SAM-dependent methyltransferase
MHSSPRTTGAISLDLLRLFGKVILRVYLPVVTIAVALQFPYDTDPSIGRKSTIATSSAAVPSEGRQSAVFYEAAYRQDPQRKRGLDYERTAELAANQAGMEKQVSDFVRQHNLADKRVLEVGSGRGYLQDMVDDYTGLDLSPSVASHYHKKFVVGSATNMPFADATFDAIWTVWVLEHIPEPERALMEMRRTLKPGGVLFLYVAWNCTPWAADGFEVRPYNDFNWRGKLVKASLPVRQSVPYLLAYFFPIRAIRWAQYSMLEADTRLRFRALDPNYDTYWQPDSDAAVSLDSFETMLWFRSRGDECLNCSSNSTEIQRVQNPLILRVKSER